MRLPPYSKAARRTIVLQVARALRLTCPDNRGENFQPVFIIGSGRSGNTLLRRILMAHPDVYIPPETYALGPAIDDFRAHSFLSWPALSRLVLSAFAWHREFETFNVKSLASLHERTDAIASSQRSLAALLNCFYSWLAEAAKPGATVWGDKTPINVYHLDKIAAVFPNARYVHIIRDGCDVAQSYLEYGRYDDVRQAGRRWLEAVTLSRALGQSVPDRYLEMRYEELVSQPEAEVRRLCVFLDLDYRTGMVREQPSAPLGDVETRTHHAEVLKPISTRSVGKGHARLTAEQKRILQEEIGAQMDALGYERPMAKAAPGEIIS